MVVPEGVHTLSGRLATFNAVHHLSKRRASSVKKKNQSTVTWPHEPSKTLNPEDLAAAGFYYKPTSDSNDNCVCFLCDRNLDGWEASDSPALEHLKHGPDCGWAVNSYIHDLFLKGKKNDHEEDPLSEKLLEARKATFQDAWPHEKKKGWKCKVKKMTEAGWVYDPSPDYEDAVSCPYCDLSLDGWEPKDDPIEEHKRRATDCPFFTLVDRFASTRSQTKAKKVRTSRSSKASRVSTQSNMTAQSEALSLLNVEDVEIDEDTTVLTNDTIIVHKPKGNSRKKAAPTTKGTRGRTKKAVATDDVNSSILPDESPVDVQPVRATRRNASRTVSAQVDSSILNQTQTSTRTRATRGKGKQRINDDDSQSQLDFDAAINSTIMSGVENASPTTKGTKRTSDGVAKAVGKGTTLTTDDNIKATAKTTQGTKRTSDGVPKNSVQMMVRKLDSSVIILDEALAGSGDQQGRAKRARKAPNKAEPKLTRPSNDGVAPRKASTTKGKKSKQAVRQPLAEITLDDMEVDGEGKAVHRSLPEPPQQSKTATPRRITPELSQEDASPAPSTPTPARHRISVPRTRKTVTPAASTLRKVVVTPSIEASPQSSDAENKPPSSRPMDYMGLFSPLRVPLASTPKSSPSKRNVASRLNTTFPWSATNIESVFLGNSPSKAHNSGSKDKENSASIDPNLNMDKLDKKSLAEVVKAVKSNLKPEERKMTVEEWVRWNAKAGEEKLRAECEAMVTKFERESGRAMRALEGVVSDN